MQEGKEIARIFWPKKLLLSNRGFAGELRDFCRVTIRRKITYVM
jgi:hypothetical protein